MDWKQKFEKGLNQGLEGSKKVFSKAKSRAKELGDQGVLSFELRQLESKHTDLLTKLGSKVYELLVDEQRSTVTRKSVGVRDIIDDLEQTRAMLEEKRSKLKSGPTEAEQASETTRQEHGAEEHGTQDDETEYSGTREGQQKD